MGKECKQALNESLFATSCSEMGGSMKIIVVLMAVVFMAGMAIWLFLFKNCYEMIQDIRSGTRKVPVIRKAVDKYDDCCKLEIAVNNTEVFVEKIIENEKICGLRMKAWQRIAGMVKYGIALLGIFSAVLFKGNTDEVYICAAVAAMCCVSLHFMDCMSDVDGYLRIRLWNSWIIWKQWSRAQ